MKQRRYFFQKILLLVLCILAVNKFIDIHASAQSQNHFIYLPLVLMNDDCGRNAEEQAFADLMMNDPEQQRAFM